METLAMVDFVGSGAQVQAATKVSRQATQQDSTSVHAINPAQENRQPVNAVKTLEDVAREVSK